MANRAKTLQNLNEDRATLEFLLTTAPNLYQKPNGILVQRVEMGNTVSYITAQTLKWVSGTIGYAQDLPMFKKKLNENGQLVPDQEHIEELKQRKLNWTRQEQIAAYLATIDNHKLPPILAVLTQPWADEPETANEWAQGIAQKNVIDYTPIDGVGNFGVLNISDNDLLYALDGQHRLMGIQGLVDLASGRAISRRNKSGKITSEIRIEEMAKDRGLDENIDIVKLITEKIGIEIIPSVQKGETFNEANRRVRSIFTHVNKMAQNLTLGQRAQLDDDNGFDIVAQKMLTHPLFRKRKDPLSPSKKVQGVNIDMSNIASRGNQITTLTTLSSASRLYLENSSEKYDNWVYNDKEVPIKPTDEAIEEGYRDFKVLWDMVSETNTFLDIFGGKKVQIYRMTAEEKKKAEVDIERHKSEAHLLLRPVGQKALAEAFGNLVGRGMDPEELKRKLIEYDSMGGFNIENPKNPWNIVIYAPDTKKIKATTQAQNATSKLIEYIFGGGWSDELAKGKSDKKAIYNSPEGFRIFFAELRHIGRNVITLDDKSIEWDGNQNWSSDEWRKKGFELPKPLV